MRSLALLLVLGCAGAAGEAPLDPAADVSVPDAGAPLPPEAHELPAADAGEAATSDAGNAPAPDAAAPVAPPVTCCRLTNERGELVSQNCGTALNVPHYEARGFRCIVP